MPRQRRRLLYSPIPPHLDGEALKNRLDADLAEVCEEDGSSSDESYVSEDEMVSDSGNSWRIKGKTFCYGPERKKDYRHVIYTSDIPIRDKVLTRNGSAVLTTGSMRVIKELSNVLVGVNLHVNEGRFTCAANASLNSGVKVYIFGDRPFPYYYSAGHDPLQGYVYHTADILDGGRKATFVKLTGGSNLPQHLRDTLLYLMPMPSSDVCEEYEETRFLPLDWQPSLPIREGAGRNIFVTDCWLMTTSHRRDREGETTAKRNICHIVLEVRDGVIEKLELDEQRYTQALIEQVRELGGKRVTYYTPITHGDEVVRFVKRRLRKYQKLLKITGGTWPTTLTDLQSKLRVTVPDLLFAALHDVHVHEFIPEPSCFLGSRTVCGEGHDDDGSCPLLNAVTPRVCQGSDDARAGVPVSLLMETFYTYVPQTRSYYSINRPVDKPVSITSDGGLLHFTEAELPVPVVSTPYGQMAG